MSSCLIQLELKYCERCGGLWLRPVATSPIYCSPCALAMSEMAQPKPVPHVAPRERPRRESKGLAVEHVLPSRMPHINGSSDRPIIGSPDHQICGGAA